MLLPDFTDGNPYQRELATALERRGVSVSIASGYPLATAKRILIERPSVVHLHWAAPFMISDSAVSSVVKFATLLFAITAAKAFGVEIVWTVHNLREHERRHPRLELLFRSVLVVACDGVIVHCSAAKRAVTEAYGMSSTASEKVTVVPHGNYIDWYENQVDRERARERLGLDREDVVFVHVGQIRPYKQVRYLIEEFDRLDDERAQLVVAGTPISNAVEADIAELSEQEANVTTRFQFVPEDKMQVYLNAADAIVLPYRDILTSGTVLLGMSFGRAIVAPRVGCLPELLDDQAELLYDPDDGSLHSALEAALNADLVALGRANYRNAERLDWDSIAERTHAVYSGQG
jgi:glycosyltransferase involved in cell wall biosynthesis